MVKILYCGEDMNEDCETVDEAYNRINEIIREHWEHHPTHVSEYSVEEVQ